MKMMKLMKMRRYSVVMEKTSGMTERKHEQMRGHRWQEKRKKIVKNLKWKEKKE